MTRASGSSRDDRGAPRRRSRRAAVRFLLLVAAAIPAAALLTFATQLGVGRRQGPVAAPCPGAPRSAGRPPPPPAEVPAPRRQPRPVPPILVQVTSEAGAPIPQAAVTVLRAESARRARATTGADGVAALDGLFEGRAVRVTRQGFFPAEVRLHRPRTEVVLFGARTITLEAYDQFGTAVPGLPFALERARGPFGPFARSRPERSEAEPAAGRAPVRLVRGQTHRSVAVPRAWKRIRCTLPAARRYLVWSWTQRGAAGRTFGRRFDFDPSAGPVTLRAGRIYYAAYRILRRRTILLRDLPFADEHPQAVVADRDARGFLLELAQELARRHAGAIVDLVLPRRRPRPRAPILERVEFLDASGTKRAFMLPLRPFDGDVHVTELDPGEVRGGVEAVFGGIIGRAGGRRSPRYCREFLRLTALHLVFGRSRTAATRYRVGISAPGERFRLPPGEYHWWAQQLAANFVFSQAMRGVVVEVPRKGPVTLFLRFAKGWDLSIVRFELKGPPKRRLFAEVNCINLTKKLSLATPNFSGHRLSFLAPPGKYLVRLFFGSPRDRHKLRRLFTLAGEEFRRFEIRPPD